MASFEDLAQQLDMRGQPSDANRGVATLRHLSRAHGSDGRRIEYEDDAALVAAAQAYIDAGRYVTTVSGFDETIRRHYRHGGFN